MPALPITASSSRVLLPLYVALFCIAWSSAFAVAKYALHDCPPLLLLSARFLLAGVITLGAALVTRTAWNLSARDLAALALLGVFNNALYLGLNYVGLQTVSAGLSALILSTNPVLIALLAAVLIGESLSWRKVLGLALGVGGVAFTVSGRVAAGAESALGLAFVLASLAAFVLGTVLFKRLAPRGGLWVGNGVQNIAGGLALTPFALSLEPLDAVMPSWGLIAALAYLVLVVSVIAYLLWFLLLTEYGASAASAYHFLLPPLGVLFGWLLLNEQISLRDVLGVVPVAVGIYLVTRPGHSNGPVPSTARRLA